MAQDPVPPTSDRKLPVFLDGFTRPIVIDPQAYGLTEVVGQQLQLRTGRYQVALVDATTPATRGVKTIADKDEAKDELLELLRQVCRSITNNMLVSDAKKRDLGLRIRKKPSPIPAPGETPQLSLVQAGPTWLRLRVRRGGEAPARGKPPGTVGAELFTFVGPNPPDDLLDWKSSGVVTGTGVVLNYGTAVRPGTIVYVSARWFNRRGTSHFAMPLSARLSGLPFVGATAQQPVLQHDEVMLKAA